VFIIIVDLQRWKFGIYRAAIWRIHLNNRNNNKSYPSHFYARIFSSSRVYYFVRKNTLYFALVC